MSYCQFENTMHDLTQCISTITGYCDFQTFLNNEELNEYELRAMKQLKELCEQYLELVEDSNFEIDKEFEENAKAKCILWIKNNIAEYQESITIMVETCIYDLELPEVWLDTETHWIWDIASDMYDEAFPTD